MEALNQVTGILTGLGVNQTIWIQLILFLVTFLILNNFVFKPYQHALEQRHSKTIGGEDVTKQLALETQEMQARYEKQARQVNQEIKSVYDQARSEALKKQSEIIENARKESSEAIRKARENISQEIQKARESLHKEIPVVSTLIAAKLMGKEST